MIIASTNERLLTVGKIPLRRLVYRVLPLPPSMNQYIYDFGAISGDTEDKYIERIVSNHVSWTKNTNLLSFEYVDFLDNDEHIGDRQKKGCKSCS